MRKPTRFWVYVVAGVAIGYVVNTVRHLLAERWGFGVWWAAMSCVWMLCAYIQEGVYRTRRKMYERRAGALR